jgi:O-antigen ligase
MNIKIINALCFLLPFVGQVFNLQAVVKLFYSDTYAQILAYGSLILLIIGIVINLKQIGEFSKTARIWLVFYICYYAFATIATGIHGISGNILASFVPVIYMLGFYVYLSIPQNRKLFGRVALLALVVSSIWSIYLYKINWSIDTAGIHIYDLGRAAGFYGDAGRCALVSILAFIFVSKKYNPTKIILKFLKPIILILIFYNLILTFATTGLFAFVIVFVLLNHKYFTPKSMLITIILVPMFYFTLINLNNIVAGYDLSTAQQDKVNNIVNLLTLNINEVDSSGRDELLANALNYVYKNPIIGNGIDFGVSIRAHNTLVAVWADAGIFTFLVFLFMLGNYFKNAIKCPPNIRYFSLSILFSLIIYMLTSQSVINQGLEMVIFVYLGYIIDENHFSNLTDLNTNEHV